MTVVSGWRNSFFLQDRSGGISVDSDEHPTGVKAGDAVEVLGFSDPGRFAPTLHVSAVRILGRGTLPAVRFYSYSELSGGEEDSNWIGVRGVVRSASIKPLWDQPVLTLSVEVDGGLVSVFVRKSDPGDAERLVDAVVRVRGVCTTAFNNKRQFTGLGLIIPSMKDLTFEVPAPDAPYSIPLTPIRSVLSFKPGLDQQRHRVRVSGRVTYLDPGHVAFLQDGQDGILLAIDQVQAVPLGTQVEAIGFPELGAASLMLRNAEFRIDRSGAAIPEIVPARMQAADFLQTADGFAFTPYDLQLVHLQGELVEVTARLKDDLWLLRDGNNHFSVVLTRQPGVEPPAIQIGSTLSVTGVFNIQMDENHQPAGFRVLLRSPADLVLIRRASWWTPQHLAIVLAMVLLGAMAATLWSMQLRKRVREQTEELRESEERFRKQAQQDLLTGLASRSFLLEKLEVAIVRAQRSGSRIGVLMIDLDHFKQVNDTLGHHAGDDLLRVVADRIQMSVRKSDTVARMGGDEFVVLLADLTDPAEAELIGAKIVSNVSAEAQIAGRMMMVSASVGVCTYPDGGTDGDTLLQNVDLAMYKAKSGGRNSFSVHLRSDPRLALSKREQGR